MNVHNVHEIDYRAALLIGAFQCLSLIPGTSRSGSTILGGILLGVARPAAAEFSFFMAIPAMVGASGIKMLGFFDYLSETDASVPLTGWLALAVGCAVSFIVSMIAIRFLMDFVKKHTFSAFGLYRILLGALVLLVWLL